MPPLDVARQVAQQRVREVVLVSVLVLVLVQQQEQERGPVQELEPVRLLVRVPAAQELVLAPRLRHRRLQ